MIEMGGNQDQDKMKRCGTICTAKEISPRDLARRWLFAAREPGLDTWLSSQCGAERVPRGLGRT